MCGCACVPTLVSVLQHLCMLVYAHVLFVYVSVCTCFISCGSGRLEYLSFMVKELFRSALKYFSEVCSTNSFILIVMMMIMMKMMITRTVVVIMTVMMKMMTIMNNNDNNPIESVVTTSSSPGIVCVEMTPCLAPCVQEQ